MEDAWLLEVEIGQRLYRVVAMLGSDIYKQPLHEMVEMFVPLPQRRVGLRLFIHSLAFRAAARLGKIDLSLAKQHNQGLLQAPFVRDALSLVDTQELTEEAEHEGNGDGECGADRECAGAVSEGEGA